MITRISRYVDRNNPNRLGYHKGSDGGSTAPASQTVTQTTQLPSWVRPYSTRYMERAEGLSERPYEPYEGQRVANLDDLQLQGIQQTVNSAYNPVLPAATNQMINTIDGGYLNSNPYLDSMFDRASQGVVNQYTGSVMPGIDAAANRSNALGGSAYQEYSDRARFDLGQNLNNLATQIYGGNYMTERANQQQAMLGAPQFQEGNYRQAQALVGAGDILRGYEQDLLNLGYEDYEKGRLQDYANLDVLGNAIGIGMGGGGTTITQQPSFYQASPYAGALGGGLLGYGVGSQFNSPWLGAGVGALGGSLLA